MTMRIAILCLALTGACSSAVTTADPSAPKTTVFRAEGIGGSLKINNTTDASATTLTKNAEDAYQFMPLVYDSLSIPKTWLEPKQHLISSQQFKIRIKLGKTSLSRYIDCGATQIGANADSYEVVMTVTSRIVDQEKGTSVLSTTVEAAAKPLSFNQEYRICSSRGELERRIGEIAKAMTAGT